MELCGNGTVLHLDYSGGYINLHMWQWLHKIAQKNTHTHIQVHVKSVTPE